MMRKYIILNFHKYFLFAFVLMLLESCDGTNGNSNDDYEFEQSTSEDTESMHEDVEVVNSGDDVEITDDVDETVEYIADPNLDNSAYSRMFELINDNNYIKNNGKIKRIKVAKTLNREGFTKSDGSKFTIRDIPKE